jgi:hypothetical protein
MTTISYEKALALKEAGWPQPESFGEGEGSWVYKPGSTAERFLTNWAREDAAISPSLNELIAACPRYKPDIELGSGCLCLEPWQADKWTVGYRHGPSVLQAHFGTTPEEAVASLWLQLQQMKSSTAD